MTQKVDCAFCNKSIHRRAMKKHHKSKKCKAIQDALTTKDLEEKKKPDQEIKSVLYNTLDNNSTKTMDYEIDFKSRFRKPTKYKEFLDQHMLYHIIQHPHKYGLHDNEKSKEMLNILNVMLKTQVRGILKTQYSFSKNGEGVGRVYVNGGIGFQKLKKEYRHTLAREYYKDLDIVNAHPTMLLYVCESNNIECPMLKAYVNDRESLIQQVIDRNEKRSHKVDRDMVKDAYLCLINHGTSAYDKLPLKSLHIQDFQYEMKQIGSSLKELHPELWSRIEPRAIEMKKHSPTGSFVNHFMIEKEALCLSRIEEFLWRSGIDVEYCINCFDGLMIPLEGTEYTDSKNFLNDCCKFVRDKTGIKIKLKYKPMDMGHEKPPTIDEYKEYTPFDKEDEFSWYDFDNKYRGSTFESMDECAEVIKEDLNRVFATINQGSTQYIIKSSRYTFTIESECGRNFMIKIKSGKKEKYIPLSKVLAIHQNHFNCHEELINDPNAKPTPRKFNIWRGFRCKLIPNTTDFSSIQPILYHIEHILCSGDKSAYEYFLDYFQHLFCNPGQKPKKAIFLCSKGQGTGKNIIFDGLVAEYMMDDTTYQKYNGLSEYLEKHETSKQGKKLLLVDEIAMGSNEYVASFDTMKSIITGDTININPKGKTIYSVRDYSGAIFISNHASIRVENSDRRYFCLRVSESKRNNITYFKNLASTFNQGNGDLFYTFLHKRYEKQGCPIYLRDPPMTQFKRNLINKSLGTVERFVEEHSDKERLPLEMLTQIIEVEGCPTIGLKELYQCYKDWCQEGRYKCYSENSFLDRAKDYLEVGRKESRRYFILRI